MHIIIADTEAWKYQNHLILIGQGDFKKGFTSCHFWTAGYLSKETTQQSHKLLELDPRRSRILKKLRSIANFFLEFSRNLSVRFFLITLSSVKWIHLVHLNTIPSQTQTFIPIIPFFDDDDDDELFLWYGWPAKGV